MSTGNEGPPDCAAPVGANLVFALPTRRAAVIAAPIPALRIEDLRISMKLLLPV
jgi:hypothetical protein